MRLRFQGHAPVVSSECSFSLPPHFTHRRGFFSQIASVSFECRCGCNKKEVLLIEYVSTFGLGRSELTAEMHAYNQERDRPFNSDYDTDSDEDKPYGNKPAAKTRQVIDLTDE